MTVPTLRVIGGSTLAVIFALLAIAIVSGLMIQFPLVLIVLPALLLLLGAPPAEAREPIS
jgi:hypothetical protein